MPLADEFQRIIVQNLDYCLDAMSRFKKRQSPELYRCHGSGGNQEWIFNPKLGTLKHAGSQYCLSLDDTGKLINHDCKQVCYY